MTERVAEFFPDMPRSIKLFRQANGLSQQSLVKALRETKYNVSVSQPYLAMLENADFDRLPSITMLAALAEVLGTTIDSIVATHASAPSLSVDISALSPASRAYVKFLVDLLAIDDACDSLISAQTDRDPSGFVYFLLASELGRVKIGFSSNFKARLDGLSTSIPFVLETLKVAPGTREDEAALHRRFAHLRVHREWFTDCDELREYIATLE